MSEKGNNQSSQSNADPSQMSQSDGHVSLQSDDILQQCSNDAAASHYNMQPQKVLTVTESIASEAQPSEIETDTNPTATDFDVEDKTPPLITPEVPMEKSDGGELEEKIVKKTILKIYSENDLQKVPKRSRKWCQEGLKIEIWGVKMDTRSDLRTHSV